MIAIGVAFVLMAACIWVGVKARALFYPIACALILYGAYGLRGHARQAYWPSSYHGRVVAFVPHEPDSIDIWLLQKHHEHPLYLRFPWSEKKAKALYRAEAQAAKDHSHVMMGRKKAPKKPHGQARNLLHKPRQEFYNSTIRPLAPKQRR